MPRPNAPTTILLTGFGAFPGARTNPTVEIVRRLVRSRRFARLGIAIEGRVLPVVFGAIEASLNEALSQTRPDAIIHLGLAARRKHISVEARAVNRIGFLRADASRKLAAQTQVEPRGPMFLTSRWPAARLRAAMKATGAATRISIDAGDYLCNQLLYLTLARTQVPAGFIHMPKPRGARLGAKLRRPSIGEMARAVEAVVIVMAGEHQHKRYNI